MKYGQSLKFKKPKNKGKDTKMRTKGGISKKLEFQGKCFNCGNRGHKSTDCILPKMNKPKEADVINDITKDMSNIDLTIVTSEVNLVGSNPKGWWIKIGATLYVCSDKMIFSTYDPIKTKEKVFMGNLSTSKIKGQGKVVFKMTYGKEVTMTNVLYELENRKSLVSGSLLNNHRFQLVFESNKFVLSTSGVYVRKGYMGNEIWKLNEMTV